jgi:hypothetical protein
MHKALALALAVSAALPACRSSEGAREEIEVIYAQQDNSHPWDGNPCYVFGRLLIDGKMSGDWCCGLELCVDEESESYGEYLETCYNCEAWDDGIQCMGGEPTGSEGTGETCRDGVVNAHEICYHDVTTLSTDGTPGPIVVTDLKQDGLLDVIAASTGGVNLFLDPRSEAAPSLFPLAGTPFALAVADLDGDLDDDIVAATVGAGISVLKNEGDGSLSAPALLDLPADVGGLALADLRSQGKLDIVATIREQGSFTTLFNDGAANFPESATKDLAGEVSAPGAVVAADLDSDGDVDLITANAATGNISVLLNDGEGSFPEQRVFGVGGHPAALALGDLNGDGKPDLAVADVSSNSVWVLLGSGDAELFLSPDAPQTFETGADPGSLALVDMNSDGALDILVASAEARSLASLLNEGAGTFAAPQLFQAGQQPAAVAAGDINQDGVPDLAVSYTEPPRVLVFFSTP